MLFLPTSGDQKFLSTPSARRATVAGDCAKKVEIISIHALREDGDDIIREAIVFYCIFLSTPSARRATIQG